MFNYTRILFVVMAAMAVFTSCTKNEDDYIASSLRSSDWQGKITEYYQNRWGVNGSEYSTVMGFESKDYHYTSGRGYELDYKTSSPKENYAFCTFKWFIVDGDITIIYDDDKWNPTYRVSKTLYYTLSAIPFESCALFLLLMPVLGICLVFKSQKKTNCIFFVKCLVVLLFIYIFVLSKTTHVTE